MSTITKVIMWLILAAIAVLVIMNASGFSTAVNAVGSNGNSTLSLLTGYGYKYG